MFIKKSLLHLNISLNFDKTIVRLENSSRMNLVFLKNWVTYNLCVRILIKHVYTNFVFLYNFYFTLK